MHAEGVALAYGGRPVLDDVSLEVRAGEGLALVGPNGAGKSTVLKVASGLLKPRSGRILVGGRDVTGQGPQEMLTSGLAHVLQGHSVFREMTVAEIARVIWEQCGRDPAAFALEHQPTFEVDVVRRWPSVEKAQRLLGWEAQIGIDEGIAATVEWLRGVLA